MYNVADDLNSPFMLSGRTGTMDDVSNGPNTTAAMMANYSSTPLPPRPIPVIVSRPVLRSPSDTPPDTRGGLGIQPPKLADPAPGELSPIGTAPPPSTPDDPGSPDDPSTPPDEKPQDPINRLIDLVAAQMAGGTVGGTVALPTTTTTNSNTTGAIFLLVIVGMLGFLGWKFFHRKAA